ncbi:MAG: hypothetical protein VX589_05405 [Myxococcota bacterium]|nr:hypothetical protein [Myxococcota bacterium]
MSKQQKVMPSLKLLVALLLVLVAGGYGLAWILGGSLLYHEGKLTEKARVVEATAQGQTADALFFGVAYEACASVVENIVLGRKNMDGKAPPKRLLDIRACLGQYRPGDAVDVGLETRQHRVTGQKYWRINQVGQCTIPHLPSEVSAVEGSRCDFM